MGAFSHHKPGQLERFTRFKPWVQVRLASKHEPLLRFGFTNLVNMNPNLGFGSRFKPGSQGSEPDHGQSGHWQDLNVPWDRIWYLRNPHYPSNCSSGGMIWDPGNAVISTHSGGVPVTCRVTINSITIYHWQHRN